MLDMKRIEKTIDGIIKKSIAQDASKWITVHPGGKGPKSDGSGDKKGTPVLIDEESGKILGGMGGKHTGEKMSEVKKNFTGPKTPKNHNPTSYQSPPQGQPTLQDEVKKYKDFANRKGKHRPINMGDYNKFNEIAKGTPLQNHVWDLQTQLGQTDPKSPKYKELKEEIASIMVGVVDHDAYEAVQRRKKILAGTYTPDQIQDRINTAKTSMTPASISNVPKGAPMDHATADSGAVNPGFDHKNIDSSYGTNCQTSVLAYEARRRGYNVEAMPNSSGIQKKLAVCPRNAFIDPKTGLMPETLFPDSLESNPKKYYEFLKETMKSGERYHLSHSWPKQNAGHIVTAGLSPDGQVQIYDPQSNKTYTGNNAYGYLKKVQFQKTLYGTKIQDTPLLYRVDNMAFNPEFLTDDILVGK